MDLWVSLLIQKEGRGWGKDGIVILASSEYHFIRVLKNLVQNPSKNILNIIKILM